MRQMLKMSRMTILASAVKTHIKLAFATLAALFIPARRFLGSEFLLLPAY